MVVVKAEVRTHIVGVARKIFTRNGFRKATMEEIAGNSMMGKSSIYYYFKSMLLKYSPGMDSGKPPWKKSPATP